MNAPLRNARQADRSHRATPAGKVRQRTVLKRTSSSISHHRPALQLQKHSPRIFISQCKCAEDLPAKTSTGRPIWGSLRGLQKQQVYRKHPSYQHRGLSHLPQTLTHPPHTRRPNPRSPTSPAGIIQGLGATRETERRGMDR